MGGSFPYLDMNGEVDRWKSPWFSLVPATFDQVHKGFEVRVQLLTLCAAALGQLQLLSSSPQTPTSLCIFQSIALNSSSTRLFCSSAASASAQHRTQTSKQSSSSSFLPSSFLVVHNRSEDCCTNSSSLFWLSLRLFCHETLSSICRPAS